jgi:hypothetical protein
MEQTPQEEPYLDLEREKLKAEIKNLNRSPWKTPTFWAPLLTFGIAAFTYLYLLGTGLFEDKQAHIQYVTDTLNKRAKYLDTVLKGQWEIISALNVEKTKLEGDIKILKDVKRNDSGSMTVLQLQVARLRGDTTRLRQNNNMLSTGTESILKQNEVLIKRLHSIKMIATQNHLTIYSLKKRIGMPYPVSPELIITGLNNIDFDLRTIYDSLSVYP